MRFTRVDRKGETILRIEGALDAVSAPELRPIIGTLVREHRATVTVDLSSLRLIDSSGVGALVSLYKRMHDQGSEVRAIGVHDQPLAIFQLLHLDDYFCPSGSRAEWTQGLREMRG